MSLETSCSLFGVVVSETDCCVVVCEVGSRERQVGGIPKIWDGTQSNRTVTCMVVKATVNAGIKLVICLNKSRELHSDTVNQGALGTAKTYS
ncbi:hypothetical protein TNCV_3817901 [Trichonephila clavipes]|nr:hypothetical protein TNCV_3817901 [Trichonephila clavipes]